MRKTTVYLNDDEADALRQLARSSGLSQAEVIRGAIRAAANKLPPRRFNSLGVGQSTGGPTPHWEPSDLYRKVFGEAS